ncbi:hypothetical protein C8R43DRAFT_1012788 [Mycena crocata]|nr:hypothetical protein C8R43DRAFT_1012788 [Mycena crocata]
MRKAGLPALIGFFPLSVHSIGFAASTGCRIACDVSYFLSFQSCSAFSSRVVLQSRCGISKCSSPHSRASQHETIPPT